MAVTWAQLDFDDALIDTDDLADLLRIPRHEVRTWTLSRGFPRPVASSPTRGDLWAPADLEPWISLVNVALAYA